MRKGWMGVKSGVLAAVMVGGLLLMGGALDNVNAALVTQLDFSMGAANWGGKQGRAADRLLGQEGTITLGSYQGWGDITDPVRSHGKKYSLFTSDLLGAPAPTANCAVARPAQESAVPLLLTAAGEQADCART